MRGAATRIVSSLIEIARRERSPTIWGLVVPVESERLGAKSSSGDRQRYRMYVSYAIIERRVAMESVRTTPPARIM